jgi:regulator of RNase E activity RraA
MFRSTSGITVYPGDLLHGDRNGVTTIPSNIAHQVAHACAEYAAAETVVLNCLKLGAVGPEALAKARGEQRQVVAALQERIRKS